ncbi:MAG: hypothetical protein E6J91_10275 [Deltaproteobacteria bacterium]|nr:MAG: hypothetical protein E6J91_10275 [Deltaproteobacteria bacterium]
MGCAQATNPVIDPPVLQLAGEEEQGRFLLGNIADGLATGGKHISVVAPVGLAIGVDRQTLILRNTAGPVPVTRGLVLPASPPSASAIRTEDITIAGYELSYRDAAGNWQPYCDASQSLYAIAMQGEWTTTGLHDLGTMVTFACQESGKAAKCEAWDYIPETTGMVGPGALLWDLNQACTQMAMANYCMDGEPHTREKTPILVRDFIPGAEPPDTGVTALQPVPASYPPVPPPPDQYFFEAAWAPRQLVLCLSKLRWNNYAPGGLCHGEVPDPRVDPNARFCEDAHLDLNSRNLKNGSKTMDLALRRWSSPSGDTLTTVHGYVVDKSAAPRKTVPPVGFDAPPLSNEGYLLRNLTGVFASCNCVIRAFRQRNAMTGDSVLGPDGMLSGYSYDKDADFEGWLIEVDGPGELPLYLYQSGTDYVTATRSPGSAYSKVGGPTALPIGFVIAASL